MMSFLKILLLLSPFNATALTVKTLRFNSQSYVTVHQISLPGTFKDEPQAYPFNCVEGRSSVNATKHQLMASSIFSSNPLFYRLFQILLFYYMYSLFDSINVSVFFTNILTFLILFKLKYFAQ